MSAAWEKCQKMEGDLIAFIRGDWENQFILYLARKTTGITFWGLWIGLQRKADGSFERFDSKSLEYSAENAREPNNDGENENCGVMMPQGPSAGKWNDIPCDYPFNRETVCSVRCICE